MLVYQFDDGFEGYNRLVPLFGFAYADTIPLIDVREASRPGRVAVGWTCIALTLASAVGWLALGGRPLERRALELCGPTLIFLLGSMTWSRPRPQRVVPTRHCRVLGLAPPLLLVEWSLTFASGWLMTRVDLAPFASVGFIRVFAVLADLTLIPMALLPLVNVLWFSLERRRARSHAPDAAGAAGVPGAGAGGVCWGPQRDHAHRSATPAASGLESSRARREPGSTAQEPDR